MTADEWKRVERALSFPYGHAKLKCDGRTIDASVQQVKDLRMGIVVYVDGVWRGEWLRADKPCDEQRFMNPRSKAFYKVAELNKVRRAFSAKQLREMMAKRYHWFEPNFPTAGAFRRRIKSQCKQIELVSTSQDGIEPAAAAGAAKEAA